MQPDYALMRAGLGAVMVTAANRVFSKGSMAYSGVHVIQQLGIYVTIILMTEAGEQVTTASLAEKTRLHPLTVNKFLKILFDYNVLRRVKVPTSYGGGRKYIYHPNVDIKSMLELIPKEQG